MLKTYRVSNYIMDSGERACLVIDYSRFPVYYPNLFLTVNHRNANEAFATIQNAAWHLVVLLRFLDEKGIALESRLLKRDFLKLHELDALRDYSQRSLRKPSSQMASGNVLAFGRHKEATGSVSNATQYARLTVIASYLCWLSFYLIDSPTADVASRIRAMEEQLKARRPHRRGRNTNLVDKSLDDSQLEMLFEAIRPGSSSNPFIEVVQRRNRLLILLLYHLGIRSGELLNIRIKDIDFGNKRIAIVRRADEKDDPRKREPNAKTLDRTLPLSDSIIRELHSYITSDRKAVRNADRHDYLFVTHKEGKTVGWPISHAAYHKIISVVRVVYPGLHALTGHQLRHTWNRRFSERMDSMDTPLSEERQEMLRSYLNGWKQGSGTSRIYNQRFIRRKSFEAALIMQQTGGIRQAGGIEDDDKK